MRCIWRDVIPATVSFATFLVASWLLGLSWESTRTSFLFFALAWIAVTIGVRVREARNRSAGKEPPSP